VPQGDDELFTLHFVEDHKVRVQASNGKWIRAAPSGVLTVVSSDAPGSAETFEFQVAEAPPLRGEFQLCSLLGRAKAYKLIDKHRKSFVTAQDFRNLAAKGLCACAAVHL
jgi:hypothetical protein